jgi:hypothetical protein
MSDEGKLLFKIGIIGPTRVGKTSLIASILKDGQRLLGGTRLNIKARGTPTDKRIAQHAKELAGSLRAGKFNSGAVQGTEEKFTFQLHLDPGDTSLGIFVDVLDYPGGWTDANRRPPEREDDWKECKTWIKDSTILIVPVESAVLMEAALGKHKRAAPHILTTYEIEAVAREWAKGRASSGDEPALLMLCPVKCESYFADNGGHRDHSMKLFKAVDDAYRGMIEAVKSEAPQVKIVYSPVDTIGCVEIIGGSWKDDVKAPGGYEFTADYRVRPPGRQAVKGADAVLVSICKHLVEATQRDQVIKAKDADMNASDAINRADATKGFRERFQVWNYRKNQALHNEAEQKKQASDHERRCLEALDHTIKGLAGRNFGPRVREIEI